MNSVKLRVKKKVPKKTTIIISILTFINIYAGKLADDIQE